MSDLLTFEFANILGPSHIKELSTHILLPVDFHKSMLKEFLWNQRFVLCNKPTLGNQTFMVWYYMFTLEFGLLKKFGRKGIDK